MKFEWDEGKNQSNIEKHGVSFEDAIRVFDGFTVDIVDDRYAYEELREISIGVANGVSILVVVHTDRDDICRIISARPALRKERKTYDQKIQSAFDA